MKTSKQINKITTRVKLTNWFDIALNLYKLYNSGIR